MSGTRIVPSHSLTREIFTSLQAFRRGLSLDLNYVERGFTFSDHGFFQVVINLLIFAAQLDPKNEPSVTIRGFNEHEDYTLSIGPTSPAASDRLPWGLLIPALGYLPSAMLTNTPGGRWAELSGTIKLDGAFIGRIQITLGKWPQATPGSCEITAVSSGNETIEDGSSVNVA